MRFGQDGHRPAVDWWPGKVDWTLPALPADSRMAWETRMEVESIPPAVVDSSCVRRSSIDTEPSGHSLEVEETRHSAHKAVGAALVVYDLGAAAPGRSWAGCC